MGDNSNNQLENWLQSILYDDEKIDITTNGRFPNDDASRIIVITNKRILAILYDETNRKVNCVQIPWNIIKKVHIRQDEMSGKIEILLKNNMIKTIYNIPIRDMPEVRKNSVPPK